MQTQQPRAIRDVTNEGTEATVCDVEKTSYRKMPLAPQITC